MFPRPQKKITSLEKAPAFSPDFNAALQLEMEFCMEYDICDIDATTETTITETIIKMHEAVFSLRLDPWISKTANSISGSLASEFNLNEKDLRSFINDKLLPLIHLVNNPNQRPMTECVHAWIYTSTHHYCLNVMRHLKVIEKHEEATVHERTRGKLNSIPILKSASLDPEEQLLQKEEDEEQASRATEIRVRVRAVIESYPPDYVTIAYLRGIGKKPKEIAAKTQIPLKTIYGRLKAMQKAVIEEIGLGNMVETKDLKKGVEQLLASSLQDLRV
jgi:DNA-directed RNA polymerase specialized sigma24 family protein